MKNLFKRVNEKWLNDNFKFSVIFSFDLLWNELTSINTHNRQGKLFDDLCNKFKIRKTTELRNMSSVNELTFATKVSLKDSRLNDPSKLIVWVFNLCVIQNRFLKMAEKIEENK